MIQTGSMNVASYALFSHPLGACEQGPEVSWRGWFYVRFLPALVRAHHACFPSWELRIHHDSSILNRYYGDVLLRLADEGLVRLVPLPKPAKICEGMLWRMMPAWDPYVDAFITRDIDSLPTPRDRVMVDEWLESGADVHVIHDSQSHTGLMGGMCGYRAKPLRDRLGMDGWNDLLKVQAGLEAHGYDQILLNQLAPKLEPIFTHSVKAASISRGARPVASHQACPSFFPETRAWTANILGSHVGAPVNPAHPVEFYDGPGFSSPVHDRILEVEADLDAIVGESEPERVRPMKRAIVSCSLNTDYSFFLPMLAVLWRRTGFTPTFFLVGTPEEWNQGAHGVAALEARKRGAELWFVPHVEERRDSTVAQVCRLGACTLPESVFPNDAWAITTDADMWPLRPEFFDQPPNMLTIWYANAYLGEDKPHYPLCYIGATGELWRHLVVAPEMRMFLGMIFSELAPGADAWESWIFDEYWISKRIADYEAGGGAVRKIDRRGGPPIDRLDRSEWPRGRALEMMAAKNASDAHMCRPGQHPDNWPSDTRTLFLGLVPGAEAWVDRYFDAYMAAGGGVRL